MGVRALRAAYRAGTLSPHDVVDELLARIAERGDDHTWITVATAVELHERAAELAALPESRRGELHGVPVAVKDNIDVAGMPTTAACPTFAYFPERDAGAVRRLRAAGAIVVGKTNLDQFATGLNGTRSPYGAPESVFGGDLISGGSSSGSGVAVAAGIVPAALGTDTAGSGRVPAALNGIVGLKPSRELVGASGVVPACRSLDCVSVFARDLADAATVLDVLAGPDPDDPWSRQAPPAGRPRDGRQHDSRQHDGRLPDGRRPDGIVVAIPDNLDFSRGDGHVDQAMAEAFARAAGRAASGAEAVVRTDLEPLLEAGDLLYEGPWVAERLADLQDFISAKPTDVLPVTRAVLERGAEFSAVDVFRARHRLQELRAWAGRLFERADVLLLPTVPTTFTRAELAEEPVRRNLVLGRYTQHTNLLDLAAIAVPVGMTADGRPAGVTLVGPAFCEARLLHAAAVLLPP